MGLFEEIEKGTARKTVIHFPNHERADIVDGIESGTLSLKKNLCADNGTLNFGGCIASEFSAGLFGHTITTDTDIEVYQEIITDDETYTINLFSGRIDSSQIEESADSQVVTAYDKFYYCGDVNVASYYDTIGESTSLLSFFNGLMDYVGIPVASTCSLRFEDMVIKKAFSMTELPFTTVIRAICELCGGFGVINAQGEFDIVYLQNVARSISVIPVMSGYKFEGYTVKPIDGVVIKSDESDVGGKYPAGEASENALVITGNMFTFGQDASTLQNIAFLLYQNVSNLTYTPFSAELAISNPLIELDGEIVTIQGANETISTYLMASNLSGIMLMEQTIESYGDEVRSETTIDASKETFVTNSKITSIQKDVDGISAKVEAIEEDYATATELKLTEEGLNVQIEQIQKQIDGSIEIFYTDGDEELNLRNYPAYDWTTMRCDGTVRTTDTTAFTYSDEEFQKHLRSLCYNTDSDMSYRFMKQDGQFLWQVVQDTETAVILSKIYNLELTTDGLTSTTEEIQTDLNGTKGNVQTLTSQIKQTSDSVTAEVTRAKGKEADIEASLKLKIGENDAGKVISMLTGTADEIKFTGKNSVSFEGDCLTIDADNFSLDEYGNLKATNANLSGIINASAGGRVGGFIIGPSSIYSGKTSRDDTTNNGVYVGTDGIALGKGSFVAYNDGLVLAKNLRVFGDSNISGGKIGNFIIGASSIYNGKGSLDSTASGVYLGTNGISLGGKFKVDVAGNLTATNADISGTVTSNNATITGGNITIKSTSTATAYIDVTYGENEKNGYVGAKVYPWGLKTEYYGKMQSSGTTTTQLSSFRGTGITFGNGDDSAPNGEWSFTSGNLQTSGSGMFESGLETRGNIKAFGGTIAGNPIAFIKQYSLSSGVTQSVTCNDTRGIAKLICNGGNAKGNKGVWYLFCNTDDTIAGVIEEVVGAVNCSVTSTSGKRFSFKNNSVSTRWCLIPIYGEWY